MPMMHLAPRQPARPFTDWLADVDRLLIKRVGLDSGSIEDWPWHSEFDCGVSPQEAVADWIGENL